MRRKRAAPRDLPQGREGRDHMKYLFAAVMLASAVVGFSEAASAAGGCGPGWYRGPYGGCRPMGRAVVVAPAPVVVAPPVVVVRPRVCPYGFRWYAGRCRPF
ncbi:hypothetical protein FXB40_35685 [Bradyrhizobium rifense]|uniref:Uncharacterized protein n=2 Tax=Nitrobacteraceae TaxID=41294 RepID=A0A5D3KAA7_9BRAD|nr:hypothetical protein FXB40_35685 [Bradyrhizobium rifense]